MTENNDTSKKRIPTGSLRHVNIEELDPEEWAWRKRKALGPVVPGYTQGDWDCEGGDRIDKGQAGGGMW